MVFGRLTVIRVSERPKYLVCKCECGTEKEVHHTNLGRSTVSCGCLNKEMIRNYRIHRVPCSKFASIEQVLVNRTWKAMIQRCLKPNCKTFHRYGGRGITICARWMDFRNFWDDMGSTFRFGLQIERKNNNGNYEPDNCCWATPKEECRNKSNNRIITFLGESKPMVAWAEQMNLHPKTLRWRIVSGWSVEKSLTHPVTKSPV